MRISDWSSDVCSSDLRPSELRPCQGAAWRRRRAPVVARQARGRTATVGARDRSAGPCRRRPQAAAPPAPRPRACASSDPEHRPAVPPPTSLVLSSPSPRLFHYFSRSLHLFVFFFLFSFFFF